MMRSLIAKPEPIAFDASRTALIVVDMQNGYCSPGGYFSKLGVDLAPTQQVIPAIAELTRVTRDAGVQVVWLQNGWDAEQKEAGGLGSVNQLKGNSLKLMRQKPELHGQLLTKGGWDYELVKELTPDARDIVIPKPRYSGFTGTQLDSILRSRRIDTVLVCGTATNVCVESTIRDAYFKEYYPVLVRDACYQAGPDFIQEATIYNVERFFGWTTSLADISAACAADLAA
jgi:ureidoacrylate peracid hydrolase